MRRHREVYAKPVYRHATPWGSLRKAGIPVCDVLRVNILCLKRCNAGIYEVFCNHKNFYIGKQPEPFPGTNTVIYLIYCNFNSFHDGMMMMMMQLINLILINEDSVIVGKSFCISLKQIVSQVFESI